MQNEALKKNEISNLKVEVYAGGEIIFDSGESSNGKLYYILEGEVSIRVDGFALSRVYVLQKGSFFGETSLLDPIPRNETVTVISRIARILALNGIDYSKSVDLNKTMLKKLLDSANNRLNIALNYFLSRKIDVPQETLNYDILTKIRKKNLAIIEKIHTPNNMYYDEKHTIYRENDLGKDSFYILEIGQVVTKRKQSEKSDYSTVLLHEQGDIFGEQAYFGSDGRKERAIVVSNRAKLREIHHIAFETLINFESDFYINFIQSLVFKAYLVEQKIRMANS
jgi:CRP-like cAMP-binding protein